MKKKIIGAVLLAVSVVAFGFVSRDDSKVSQEGTLCSKTTEDHEALFKQVNSFNKDLVYNVSSRFNNTVTKQRVDKAKSIIDMLPNSSTQIVKSYKNVIISILHDRDKATDVFGENEILNKSQITLLKSIDYTSNIRIRAIGQRVQGDQIEDFIIDYHMTVVPEKAAEYKEGREAFIDHIKEKTKTQIKYINQDELQPGRVSFVVTKKGKVTQVELDSTSGYTEIDMDLIQLIERAGMWKPAKNAKGKNVDQKLVFFFGKQGC